MPSNESRQEQSSSPPQEAPTFVVTHRLVFNRGGLPGRELFPLSVHEREAILEWCARCVCESLCQNLAPVVGSPRSPIARRRFGGMVRPEGLRRVVYVMTEADREKGELVERIYDLVEGWRASGHVPDPNTEETRG